MKKLSTKLIWAACIAGFAIAVSCTQQDEESHVWPSGLEFNELRHEALQNRLQTFNFNVGGEIEITTSKGVKISFDSNCLRKNGNAVTGSATLQVIELFNAADMAVANKTTMGRTEDGDRALMVSGGEFYIQAYQGRQKLTLACDGLSLEVPTALTNGANNEMSLWSENPGTVADTISAADVDWVPLLDEDVGVASTSDTYYLIVRNFGWLNLDCFYHWASGKTTMAVDVPNGYNNTNSAVYLSFDNISNGLYQLSDYDADTELFREVYGLLPVGVECHVIFVTEEDGMYRYATKGVTISEGIEVQIVYGETTVGTEADVVAAIIATHQ